MGDMVPQFSGYPHARRRLETDQWASPCIVRGAVDARGLACWTPEALAAEIGDENVEIMTGRSESRHYELARWRHRSRVRLREFLDRVATVRSNDEYLVARNRMTHEPRLQAFMTQRVRSVRLPFAFSGMPNLWIGGTGTITPTHFDKVPLWWIVVCGRKRVVVMPNSASTSLRPFAAAPAHSSVDTGMQTDAFLSILGDSDYADLQLDIGDALYMPPRWWHRAENLLPTVMLTARANVTEPAQ